MHNNNIHPTISMHFWNTLPYDESALSVSFRRQLFLFHCCDILV